MAQMQSRGMMMAAPLKPQRYIPLRVILILICAALLFCGWRWGIKNVKNAMHEPSIIDEYAFDEGEDPSVVQARYDSLGSGAEEEEETSGYEPVHEIYDWFYRES